MPCVQGLKEILEKRGKLVATLYQGEMGGFTKKTNGSQINPPKPLEREQVSRRAEETSDCPVSPSQRLHIFSYVHRFSA